MSCTQLMGSPDVAALEADEVLVGGGGHVEQGGFLRAGVPEDAIGRLVGERGGAVGVGVAEGERGESVFAMKGGVGFLRDAEWMLGIGEKTAVGEAREAVDVAVRQVADGEVGVERTGEWEGCLASIGGGEGELEVLGRERDLHGGGGGVGEVRVGSIRAQLEGDAAGVLGGDLP